MNYVILNISIHLGESSSCHLLTTVENRLKQTSKKKFQSKSLDDLSLNHHRYRQINDNHVSNTTRTEMDLSGIGCDNHMNHNNNSNDDNDNDLKPQRSQSAPVSPTKIYDKEFAAFIQCEQQQQQQELISNSFVYNIDLSDTNETSHQVHSRTAIFFVSILLL